MPSALPESLTRSTAAPHVTTGAISSPSTTSEAHAVPPTGIQARATSRAPATSATPWARTEISTRSGVPIASWMSRLLTAPTGAAPPRCATVVQASPPPGRTRTSTSSAAWASGVETASRSTNITSNRVPSASRASDMEPMRQP